MSAADHSTWALAGLTALTGACLLAGWLFASREPAVAPAQPAVQPLPLALPAPPSTASSAAPAASPQAPKPSTAALAKPPTAPPIGSEGYGPHIERAQAGNDPAAAWDAVQWLRSCAANGALRQSAELVRNEGVAPDFMTQRMVELDAEARRCQTVTGLHRALLPELAARAMRGGVPEAASAYAGAVFPGELTPEQRREVVDAMRRDAFTGDANSLIGAAMADAAWGLSDGERLAFLFAYSQLPNQPGAQAMVKALIQQGAIRLKSPPTPEQLATAKQAGEQILERSGPRPRP